ncbi:TonB system transport protein ExbD [Campylobacter blaseri]|uniref:Biopolymer transporter ExbD n=1 Tax=Campylobacter blaseri TaxID=2042961 RepID=A0A2P8R404_9BACT|nr:biopolymer transporter ExbD [Campylobacter blaseri]PSM53230.1 biopolymer transporter ExbD [Campylobacter blaseri]PSM54696.1 biopolymer transporter ExbD [Campylobacter blaseri]QKF86821.1 TonB system transport protein ExbD [Campylobacter blaseri]
MIKVEDEEEISDINITPFIDVMLVLLIAFIVTIPLVTTSIDVELPKVAQDDVKQSNKKPTILSIDKNRLLKVNDINVELENIEDILLKQTNNSKDEVIFFYVDKDVNYEFLMKIITKIKKIGYLKIALSAEIKNDN